MSPILPEVHGLSVIDLGMPVPGPGVPPDNKPRHGARLACIGRGMHRHVGRNKNTVMFTSPLWGSKRIWTWVLIPHHSALGGDQKLEFCRTQTLHLPKANSSALTTVGYPFSSMVTPIAPIFYRNLESHLHEI